MTSDKKSLLLPILLITIGARWLLTTLGVNPGIDWGWTFWLAAVGLLAFVLGGIDKVTVVIGPLFILASFLSILRQTNRLRLDVEVPVPVVNAGVLLLIDRMSAVPVPKWVIVDPKATKQA